ncbi:hypothetical protein Q9L58_010680, partial [Maublancomyces gigas]
MSEGAEPDGDRDHTVLHIESNLKRILTLEKRSNTPPSLRISCNDPVLVEKVASLTTKVAELERLILLRPAAPSPPRATSRPPPGTSSTTSPTPSGPHESLAQVTNKKAQKAKPTTPPTPAAPV